MCVGLELNKGAFAIPAVREDHVVVVETRGRCPLDPRPAGG